MINIKDYGYIPGDETEQTDKTVARVTAVHRERYELVCEYGTTFGKLKSAEYYSFGGSETFPTAGDFVLIDYIADGESRIVKTLPRKSVFTRLDPSSAGHYEQAVAANFDYVFIMQSLNDNFNLRRLERYLTLAWQSGAVPVVVLTKADLADDETNAEKIRAAEKTAAGVCVVAVSAKNGYGLDLLSEYLKERKTLVFLGSSGVGKSSLVNALAGEDIMAVNEIREDDDRGRHTTTHRQLIMLRSGVMIIDTPGMRELGMWEVDDGIGRSFADVEQYFGKCRYRDCTHKNEPGCAILAAIESGELSSERYESYIKLKTEARNPENRLVYDRQKHEWAKNIAKKNKQLNKSSNKR